MADQVERWFGLITNKMIRRSTFHLVAEFECTIYAWLAEWNGAPKAFVWNATADVMLARCEGYRGLSTQFNAKPLVPSQNVVGARLPLSLGCIALHPRSPLCSEGR